MKPTKYFFQQNVEAENCYTLDFYREMLIEMGLKVVLLVEAIREYHTDYFWCSEFRDVYLKDDSDCGKICESYKPRNGKNGRCKFSENCFTEGNRKYKLTVNGLEELK
jgi:hypothetical protein